MALEDKDIFNAVFTRFSDQPIEFIMEQYEKARKLNVAIESRLNGCSAGEQAVAEQSVVAAVPAAAPAEEAAPKKKYTKRMLKVKPQEAIQEDCIYCCICGDKKSVLTSAHLANHDITPDEYRVLCSYDAKQPLMSKKREEQSKIIIARAQAARKAKMSSK
ncbi:MAG: MucR family transcriptional regulator [Desulfovibrio sp.]|nr:MucR family transcriptional regulator [Desulfovibrio sp.]